MAEPISIDPLTRLAERQDWITPRAEIAAQKTVAAAFEVFGQNADKVRGALHGDWLHEPLHAVLTDIPVGAWTGTVVFDSLSALGAGDRLNVAADASLVLGLAGAAAASITGINDWAEIHEAAPRRIGAVHALLNVGATALFAASCWSRRKAGSRPRARALAALGYLLVSASAHLGGNLVYEHGVGVEGRKAEASAEG